MIKSVCSCAAICFSPGIQRQRNANRTTFTRPGEGPARWYEEEEEEEGGVVCEWFCVSRSSAGFLLTGAVTVAASSTQPPQFRSTPRYGSVSINTTKIYSPRPASLPPSIILYLLQTVTFCFPPFRNVYDCINSLPLITSLISQICKHLGPR